MRSRLAWAGALAAAAACSSGFEVDPAGYCRGRPDDPACPTAGAAGTQGAGGSGGSPAGASGASGTMGTAGAGTGGSSGLGGGGAGGVGGLVCNAPQVDCGGTCVDVASDAANCGACGYACGVGSTCTAGACSPVAVISGVVAPYAFVLDAENLYFAVPVKDGTAVPPAVPPAVQRVPRAGGAPTSVFGTIAPVRSRSLALVDGTLYFGDLDSNGVIRKGATTGGDVDTHLANQPAVQHLVAADGRLWWSTTGGDTSRLRRATTMGTPAMAEELVPGPSFVQFGRVPALAVEGTGAAATAFWVNAGGSVATDQGLWRKAGTAAPVKLVPDGSMVTLALGNGEVYVADATAGIGKVASNAPAPATLTPVVPAPQAGGAVQ
ncbi:MAG TPA: hypothetical protein VFS00_25290, partial [Polyangiaceae bacterium]|nr:hypothetical protein [Polyangiaceae bacterium]